MHFLTRASLCHTSIGIYSCSRLVHIKLAAVSNNLHPVLTSSIYSEFTCSRKLSDRCVAATIAVAKDSPQKGPHPPQPPAVQSWSRALFPQHAPSPFATETCHDTSTGTHVYALTVGFQCNQYMELQWRTLMMRLQSRLWLQPRKRSLHAATCGPALLWIALME
jgi:hypothetical protein